MGLEKEILLQKMEKVWSLKTLILLWAKLIFKPKFQFQLNAIILLSLFSCLISNFIKFYYEGITRMIFHFQIKNMKPLIFFPKQIFFPN